MEQLSDRGWRIWTNILMYANEQGTDGLVPRTAFRFLHAEGVTASTLDELCAADLIEIVDAGALKVRDWVGMGQERAVRVEQRRQANRQKAQAYRDRKRPPKAGDVTGDVTGLDAGQDEDRTGTGQARLSTRADANADDPVTSWPVRVPGAPT